MSGPGGVEKFWGDVFALDYIDLSREELSLKSLIFTRKAVDRIDYGQRMSPGGAWIFNAGSGKHAVDAAADYQQIVGDREKDSNFAPDRRFSRSRWNSFERGETAAPVRSAQ